MNATTLTVTEAVRHFSEYVSRVVYRHETFVLCKGRKPVAELHPVPSGRRLGDLPAILRSLPRLSEDDTAAFLANIEASRQVQSSQEARDPWAS